MQLPENLPDDPEELKKIIINKQNQIQTLNSINQKKEDQIHALNSINKKKEDHIHTLENRIIQRDKAIQKLQDMFHDLQRMKFGIRSEKIDPTIYYQDLFFNEAELGLHDESTLFESHSDDTEVKAHKRKKVGRRPLPDHLERIPDFHDISEEEKTCSCGHRLTEISPEISEQIVIKPPEVYVRQHQRRKYVCNHCKGDERNEAGKIVITAPYKTPQILPGSNLTVETLSFLLIFKWLDAIPLYRLSQMLLRNKIEIPRSTMSNWVIGVYLRYRELFSFFRKLLMTGRLIGIDETTYQVHREEGRKNTSVSYLWAFRGGFPNKPIIYYQYRISRSAEFLKEFLNGYNGIIQTDALATYNAHLKENPHILLAGCFAHVRRKFENTFRKSKEKSAEKILYTIKKIYEVEEKIRNRDYYRNREFDKIVEKRQNESKPLMDHLYNLISEEFKNPKKSDGLKVAINYALKEWKKIILYLDHGEIYINNNLVENAIRPFVLGRKNWLFADVPEGAEASAMYLSIIQTFKANGLNPQTACEEFFSKLPTCNTPDEAENLFTSIIGWG
ncbi:MAG: IS66 family transposase [Leptospiraceae bacterium]|nr:IS66 family transposase [Leptospiraceae bacterium]